VVRPNIKRLSRFQNVLHVVPKNGDGYSIQYFNGMAHQTNKQLTHVSYALLILFKNKKIIKHY
jgi:hypothetical protein